MKNSKTCWFVVGAVALGACNRSEVEQSGCMATDATTVILRDALVTGASAPDSANATFRAQNNIPLVPAANVQVVMDSATCVRAAGALAESSSEGTSRRAWVLRVGPTRFVALNYKQRASDAYFAVVFDSAFAKLGVISFER